jgi:Uma2 family endonuclease
LDVTPELAIEVRSPDDRWADIWEKVGEFLNAGVQAVCVLDDATRTARIYTASEPERVLQADEELTLPEILGDFRIRVGNLFE